jgi:hypothetical protein
MKDGSKYAPRVKKTFSKLRRSMAPVLPTEPDCPLRRLGIAILGVGSSDEQAEKAVEKCFETMVDWNEVRVSTPREVQKATGLMNENGLACCRRLVRALEAIYRRENALCLDQLRTQPRREARQYLESLDGVDAYAAASVMLWSLGGHAIPANDRLLAALREADMIHPDAERHEVQAFLERNISAADAKLFSLVMRALPSKRKRASTTTRAAKSSAKKAGKTARRSASNADKRTKKADGRKKAGA